MGVVVLLYFFLKKVLPKNKKTEFPFKKKNLAFLKKIDSQKNKNFILFLDIDNTLLSVSKKKPNHKNYETIEHKEIDEPIKILYVTKRNNLNKFLKESSKYFQLYIYTSGSKLYAEEITNLIDTKNLIQKFYSREDMKKIDGKYYKDLSIIKKKLSQIIILDNNPDFVLQKDNVFKIKSFEGDKEDFFLDEFLGFIRFLENEKVGENDDLRVFIKKYNKIKNN